MDEMFNRHLISAAAAGRLKISRILTVRSAIRGRWNGLAAATINCVQVQYNYSHVIKMCVRECILRHLLMWLHMDSDVIIMCRNGDAAVGDRRHHRQRNEAGHEPYDAMTSNSSH